MNKQKLLVVLNKMLRRSYDLTKLEKGMENNIYWIGFADGYLDGLSHLKDKIQKGEI